MTAKSITGSDYPTILETTTSGSAQAVNFHAQGGLSIGAVHVWACAARKVIAAGQAT
ncbi:hypothetical protein [Streptomyces sp. NPDC049040]|uniref:hypothetical protein n=1 Tax=Streptomyces sp. NPDC049040 TaxID=3365593 RepID=UPI003713608F